METFIILIILLILSCMYDITSTILHNLSAYIIIISPENLPLASTSPPLLFKEKSERVAGVDSHIQRFVLVSVCYTLCCHPIYSGRQTCGRTNRGHTGLLHLPSAVLALFCIARRIQPPPSLVDHEVESCVPTK